MIGPRSGRSTGGRGTLPGSRRSSAGPASTLVAAALVAGALIPAPAGAQSLRGSPGTVERQNRAAEAHGYTFLRDADDVRRFVEAGHLVRIRSDGDFEMKRLGLPYARPEVQTFLSRLGRQYRRGCGETLVVTSLTRPRSRQPWNASARSVHPTGMAMDLRRSTSPACRRWLEGVLLRLEGRGVLEAVRERRPPHYHVALFPEPYAAYVATRGPVPAAGEGSESYRVRRGDSLWEIARRFGTSPGRLRSANGLRGSRLYPGQLLQLP